MNINMTKRKIIITSLAVFVGGSAGFAYYYFIGCTNGCVIQSNPWISTLYGAFTGFILTFSFKRDKPKQE
jgi:hypothetical protein